MTSCKLACARRKSSTSKVLWPDCPFKRLTSSDTMDLMVSNSSATFSCCPCSKCSASTTWDSPVLCTSPPAAESCSTRPWRSSDAAWSPSFLPELRAGHCSLAQWPSPPTCCRSPSRKGLRNSSSACSLDTGLLFTPGTNVSAGSESGATATSSPVRKASELLASLTRKASSSKRVQQTRLSISCTRRRPPSMPSSSALRRASQALAPAPIRQASRSPASRRDSISVRRSFISSTKSQTCRKVSDSASWLRRAWSCSPKSQSLRFTTSSMLLSLASVRLVICSVMASAACCCRSQTSASSHDLNCC
mmetsp:Transcript_84693/g.196919  ORF Transcript_84693/g.196919 Transcript_84693/m.196919 type:complete len:306 (-) Transcript_84693:429-1346(-)